MDILNVYVTVLGWLAYNIIVLSMEKDRYDEQHTAFPLKQYIGEHWDNWAASLVMVPVLLWLGYRQLDIIASPLDEHASRITWSDLYYLASGFATEFVIRLIKKLKG